MKKLCLMLSLAAAGAALADDAGLQRCRRIADSTARLACYDALAAQPAAPPAPATPSASAPARPAPPAPAAVAPRKQDPAEFGLEAQSRKVVEATELKEIHSHIPGVFNGWGPNSHIRLANGQVWRIADDSSRYYEKHDPRVTVRRGMLGAFYLDVEGDNRSPRVRRVQ